MNWLKQLLSRHRLYGDLSEEIREHLEEKVEALKRNGMSRKDAEFAARREFGNVTLVEEGARDVWRWPCFENLLGDVRYGFRMLRNKPRFSLVAIVTLALGIGANTAIFSVVDAALIRPLPYWQANRLITLSEVRPQEGKSGETDTRTWDASYPDYLDWTRQSKSFQSLAGFSGDQSVSASPCFQAWGKRTGSTKRSISLDRSLWYQNRCDTREQVEQQRCLQQQIPLWLVCEVSS